MVKIQYIPNEEAPRQNIVGHSSAVVVFSISESEMRKKTFSMQSWNICACNKMFPLFSADSTRAYCDKLLKDAHSQSVFHGTAQASGEPVGVTVGSAVTVSCKNRSNVRNWQHSTAAFISAV